MSNFISKLLVLIFTIGLISTQAFGQDLSNFLKQAKAGDKLAQYNVCVAYLNGIDTTKNPKKAASWCKKSA